MKKQSPDTKAMREARKELYAKNLRCRQYAEYKALTDEVFFNDMQDYFNKAEFYLSQKPSVVSKIKSFFGGVK